jgi:aspartyl-tRNA(Asn)/glutamyl-tRNA(Gln) amidotransferase subunit A
MVAGSSTDLTGATIAQLRAGFASRSFSPSEVVAALAARIEAEDAAIGAFTATCLDQAAAQAREASKRIVRRAGVRMLEGVPFAAKDLLDTAGLETTYGSLIFAGHVPSRTAAAVETLQGAGAILLGKTATHEFGWGITTTSAHGSATRNPWSPARVAGGSSGGSAAALATFEAPLALGTDTAGSIRIPADFCGIVGFKPSRGAISRAGAFPLAPSLDHVGPMARTPQDAELAFRILAGRVVAAPDHRPRTSLVGLRIGVSEDLHPVELEAARETVLGSLYELAVELGGVLVELDLPAVRGSFETLATIVLAEGRRVHRERGIWPAARSSYGSDVRMRLEQAERVTSDQYAAATSSREEIAKELDRAFERVDLLLAPISSVGPAARTDGPGDSSFRRAVMSCTAPQSLAGIPACALRAGFDENGIPVGIQVVGPRGADLSVLATAHVLFTATRATQDRWPPAGLPSIDG